MTLGKRQVQAQKRAKAQAKTERREARHSGEPEPDGASSGMSEPEIMEELATLSRALEAGEISLQEFEERREHLRSQLERLQ
jgi:hypothetical protein